MKRLLKKFAIYIIISALLINFAIPVFAGENKKANDIKILLDGDYITFSIAPFIENGQTFVPFRDIFEAFGLCVNYSESSRQIYASLQTDKNSLQYYIILNENTMTCEAAEYDSDNIMESSIAAGKKETKIKGFVTFQIKLDYRTVQGKTFVPARLIAESLGCKVTWDDKAKTVIINSVNAVITDKKGNAVTLDRSGIIETKSAQFKATEDEIVKLVNKARKNGGMSELEQDETLTKIARMKAGEMAENRLDKLEFPSGVKKFLKDNFVDAISHVYYCSIGKNTPAEVVNEWRKRASFDNDIYAAEKTTQIGIGGAKAADGTTYWVYIAIKPFGDKEKNALENEFIRLLNEERNKQGLNPIAKNDDLMKIARMKAQDMADKDYFSHYSPTYGYPGDMVRKYIDNITFAGENITSGAQTANAAFTALMKSGEHKAVMLEKTSNIIGVGIAMDAAGNFRWSIITAKK